MPRRRLPDAKRWTMPGSRPASCSKRRRTRRALNEKAPGRHKEGVYEVACGRAAVAVEGDHETGRIESPANPFAAKLSPMSAV